MILNCPLLFDFGHPLLDIIKRLSISDIINDNYPLSASENINHQLLGSIGRVLLVVTACDGPEPVLPSCIPLNKAINC